MIKKLLDRLAGASDDDTPSFECTSKTDMAYMLGALEEVENDHRPCPLLLDVACWLNETEQDDHHRHALVGFLPKMLSGEDSLALRGRFNQVISKSEEAYDQATKDLRSMRWRSPGNGELKKMREGLKRSRAHMKETVMMARQVEKALDDEPRLSRQKDIPVILSFHYRLALPSALIPLVELPWPEKLRFFEQLCERRGTAH